jgi:hypothetical protein
LPITDVGLLLLATAGALIIYDQFFDSSGSWMRFRLAEARLRVMLADFRFGWAELMAKVRGDPWAGVTIGDFTKLLRDFVRGVEELAEAETREWAEKFRANIESFDRNPSLRLGREAGRDRSAAADDNKMELQRSHVPPGEILKEVAPGSRVLPVKVGLEIERRETLDPDSLIVTLNGEAVDIPPKGPIEVTLQPDKEHTITAEAKRNGQAVRDTRTLRLRREDEESVIKLDPK